jgi:hypothetical protein
MTAKRNPERFIHATVIVTTNKNTDYETILTYHDPFSFDIVLPKDGHDKNERHGNRTDFFT